MDKLLQELDKWGEIYEFNFQFWGRFKNSVYIWKNDVVIFEAGGLRDSKLAVKQALNWVYKVNRVPISDRLNLSDSND